MPLQAATERLGRAWGMVRHLNSVMDSPPLRETFNANLPRVTEFWTRLGQTEGLFARYKALRASEAYERLDPERARVVDAEARAGLLEDLPTKGGTLVDEGDLQVAARRLCRRRRFAANDHCVGL